VQDGAAGRPGGGPARGMRMNRTDRSTRGWRLRGWGREAGREEEEKEEEEEEEEEEEKRVAAVEVGLFYWEFWRVVARICESRLFDSFQR